jgi:hypothetical protein
VERRFAVHAGTHRQALIAVLALVCSPAAAAPKGAKAKALFDKGVKLYTKGEYQAAAEVLGKSVAIEADAETLFALAQTQRKLDHCDLAIPIYDRLLAMEMPAENKDTIRGLLEECKQIVAPAPPTPPAEEPKPVAEPPHEAHAAPEPEPEHDSAPQQPHPPDTGEPPRASPTPEGHHWYKDPVGDSLVVAGVAGVGVGVAYLLSASAADHDKMNATSYPQYLDLSNRASSDGSIAMVGLIGGGALITCGIVWYATHGGSSHAPLTGWVAPHGGGVGVAGSF